MTTTTGHPVPEPIGRRLALTPIGLDVVAALAHDPDGLRLTPLATAIGSPVSSVQAALRILLANTLVGRDGAVPPRYSLTDHPARAALVEVAIVLPDPAHVIGVTLRASPAVRFAAVDRDGFVVGLDATAPAAATDRLLASLATIADARPATPLVQVSAYDDLLRLVGVSVGTRARLASAIRLKGRLDRVAARTHADTEEVTSPAAGA